MMKLLFKMKCYYMHFIITKLKMKTVTGFFFLSKMIENRSLVQILANPYVLWVGVATDQACFNTSHEHSNKLGSEKF